MLDVRKLNFNTHFTKPVLSAVDNNILNFDGTNTETSLDCFKYVFNDDIDNLKKYASGKYVKFNLKHQTPLMLACLLDKENLIPILLNEVGIVDSCGNSALSYCKEGSNAQKLIKYYENI